MLAELEAEGQVTIVPAVRATQLTMNVRESSVVKNLAKLHPINCGTEEEFKNAVSEIGIPCSKNRS